MLHHPFLSHVPRRFQGKFWVGIAAGAIALGTTGYGLWLSQALQPSTTQDPLTRPVPPPTITALGRLEPQGEVIRLSAPTTGNRVEQLLVQQGDRVQVGQVIARLDSRDRLQATLIQAQKDIQVAQAKLAQVKAGAKQGQLNAQRAEIQRTQAQVRGEIQAQKDVVTRLEAQASTERAAQEATIARLKAQWQGDRQAQSATLRKLDAQLRNAQAEAQRYQQLYQDGAISHSLLDSKRLVVEELQQQRQEAEAILGRTQRTAAQELDNARANLDRIIRTNAAQLSEAHTHLDRLRATGRSQTLAASATLEQLAEVRPVDVAVLQADLERAIAARDQSQVNLDQATIKAPIAGEILAIHTQAGEIIGNDGIVELGNTQTMVAIAQVYQSDITQVKLGQVVRIRGDALAEALSGRVQRIDSHVKRQTIVNTDPSTNIDGRIIEVHVALDRPSSQRAAKLTNLQVTVEIQLSPPLNEVLQP